MTVELHPDFAGLQVHPGESTITGRPELFSMTNVLAFGAAADRPTHVPVELGRSGSMALWESTGAADQLPFWNTVYDGDTYLYIVHGSVRVEFKETDGDEHYGGYLARTGDLFKLPNAVAHRTFSGDGKRRVTLEIMPDNPLWALRGTRPITVDRSGSIGGFTFTVRDQDVLVTTRAGEIACPRDTFGRALRALSAWELHLGHNELDGGLTVHDQGETAVLMVPGYAETLDGTALTGVFRGLLDELGLA
ncbi:hypothetical protein [Nakamurella leprariae]|uniref:Cupin domain-containing protein n=1 Tax=Nakamurella leprariae TaxID=2803911 RepID=A0A939C2W8_9ACTN|nr:hypothetical protein [Nakamurella leprariae]MBM9468744.1 hypothetical protein [Nakamurella leprariae]